MEIAYRDPHLIKEELDDLKSLIIENQNLLETYSDDVALKLGLDSLKNHEEELIIELKNAYEKKNLDTYDIRLEGEPVKNSKISLLYLGKISTNFQELVTAIVHKDQFGKRARGPIPVSVQKASILDVVATTPGSFRVILAGQNPTLIESPVKTALIRLNELMDCEDDREKIRNISQELGVRVIKKYQKLLDTVYKNNSTLTLYDKMRPIDFTSKKLTTENAKKIFDVISDEQSMFQGEFNYKGMFKGISIISNSFEFFKEENEELIKGKFDPKLTPAIKKILLDQPILAKFSMETRYNDITDTETQEWEFLEIVETY